MPFRRAVLFLMIVCLAFPSCLARRRAIARRGAAPAQALLISSREDLLQAIAKQYAAVNNFNATVDMVPALGSAEKSKITEYKDVRGFILYRETHDIRI